MQCTRTITLYSLAHLSTTYLRGAFRVTLCPFCIVRRALPTISLNISQTPEPTWTKLGRNVLLEAFFKNCSQNLIPSKTLVAMATKWNLLSSSLKIFSSGTTDFEIISQECSFPFSKIVCLTLYLSCQFLGLPMQQQIKV